MPDESGSTSIGPNAASAECSAPLTLASKSPTPGHFVQSIEGPVGQAARPRQQPLLLTFDNRGRSLPSFVTKRWIAAHRVDKRALSPLIASGLDRRAVPAVIVPHRDGRTLTRIAYHCEHVLGLLQRHELGMGQRHPVAVALGHPSEVVNRGSACLLAMADREIKGMEVGVLAHAFPAFLVRKRSQEEARKKAIVCLFCSAMMAGRVGEQNT